MSKWPRGAAEIERLVASRDLQRITGLAADGVPLLERARRTLSPAESITATDPDSAYVLAYDAARYASTALLAHQGLRPTSSGGHYAVELAVRAQFGNDFRPFGTLRRRRNELEYPAAPTESASLTEAVEATDLAADLCEAAQQILPRLALFG